MIGIPSGYDWYDGSKLDGRKSVKTRQPRRSQRWRHIGGRRVRVMKKLDQSKVEYIVAEKRRGTKNHTIAESMGIVGASRIRQRMQVFRHPRPRLHAANRKV